MKNILMGFVLVASGAAFAQTSSTTLPQSAPSNTTDLSSPTVTQTLTTKAPAAESRFGANLIWQSWTTAQEVRENSSDVQILSDNGIGLTFKVSDKLKTEFRHRFAYTIVRDQQRLGGKDAYQLLDPTVHANYTSDLTMFGSKPITFSNRFYIPLSDSSREKTAQGVLRSQIAPTWDLNPRVSVAYNLQGRLYMYRDFQPKSDAGEAVGSPGDSVLFLLTGPSVTYNFNDSLNAYYFPYSLTQGTEWQRGKLKADVTNNIVHEIGVNVTAGPVEINPAVTMYSDSLNREGYEGLGSDPQVEYDLNIIASF